MEFKKGVKGMMKRVSGQLSDRLGKVDMESMLSAIGLEVIKHRRSIAWPVVGAFGVGVIVGALATPISGQEMRKRIVAFVTKKKADIIDGARELTPDGQPVASPYEDAKAERNIRDNNMARKPGRPPVIGEPGPHLSSPT